MPIYQYECKKCGKEGAVTQKITDPPLRICPQLEDELEKESMSYDELKELYSCDGELIRVPQVPGIAFKGSGFHVNDYRKD